MTGGDQGLHDRLPTGFGEITSQGKALAQQTHLRFTQLPLQHLSALSQGQALDPPVVGIGRGADQATLAQFAQRLMQRLSTGAPTLP